jgi:hypothetical protein
VSATQEFYQYKAVNVTENENDEVEAAVDGDDDLPLSEWVQKKLIMMCWDTVSITHMQQ